MGVSTPIPRLPFIPAADGFPFQGSRSLLLPIGKPMDSDFWNQVACSSHRQAIGYSGFFLYKETAKV